LFFVDITINSLRCCIANFNVILLFICVPKFANKNNNKYKRKVAITVTSNQSGRGPRRWLEWWWSWPGQVAHKSIKCCFWRLHIDITVKITKATTRHNTDNGNDSPRGRQKIETCRKIQQI